MPVYKIVEECVYEVEAGTPEDAIEALVQAEDINVFFKACTERLIVAEDGEPFEGDCDFE